MESNVITVMSFLAIIIAIIVFTIRLGQDDSGYEEEFVGQIIDIFEDFLTEKKVDLYNADKQGEPDEAIIYGNDYDFLAKKIRGLMDNWNVTYDARRDKRRSR